MEALVQTLLAEMPETVSNSVIMGFVPRLIQEAQKLTVPGADKKAAVVKALHEIVDAKVSKELAGEFHKFIDETIVTTVDMLIDVAKGRVTLAIPQTVEEVTQKVNCFLQFVQAILTFVSKVKKSPVPTVPSSVEAVTSTVVAEATEVTKEVVAEATEVTKEVVAEATEVTKEVVVAAEEARIVVEGVAEEITMAVNAATAVATSHFQTTKN